MKEDIQHILEKYNRNACSEEELRRLEAWFQAIGHENPGTFADDARLQRLFERIETSPRYTATSTRHSRFRRVLAVASIAALVLLGIGLAIYAPQPSIPTEQLTGSDIAAGEDKAILTLADGRKIVLDGDIEGMLAEENGITIRKNADNILIYTLHATNSQEMGTLTYNTIETPRGGQYQVILSDGTTVWLNAESSITFPTRFSVGSRQVSVRGEAYFAVVSQQTDGPAKGRIPFIVDTDQQRIEVLGTEFNVNTYSDRPQQQTTLIEGSVRVTHHHNGQQVTLEPGQQAQIGSSIHVTRADLEKEIAWKQGDFIFKEDPLSDILKQVSRWYDITVSYPEHVSELRYSGMISRQRPLSGIITMLESTGAIKIKIKERRIIIE